MRRKETRGIECWSFRFHSREKCASTAKRRSLLASYSVMKVMLIEKTPPSKGYPSDHLYSGNHGHGLPQTPAFRHLLVQ